MAEPMSALGGQRYEQYLYSYPHKLAYGPVEPSLWLHEVWAEEPKQSLFLYVHVPFCEQRCGFCNLFTFADPAEDTTERFIGALRRQMERAKEALGAQAAFARYAIGGGTPTYLSPRALARVFDDLAKILALDSERAPGSVETSPLTATAEHLAVLRERGVERISMGVQSFDDDEAAAVGRRQSARDVHAAAARIRAAGIPTLNLDLMYGLPDQTERSLLASILAALEHHPEELYLYPLYVRKLTVLGRAADRQAFAVDRRVDLYRAGRDLLLSRGYEQVSMRMFQKPRPAIDEPYHCQRDGMLGLGPGARSYTDRVHYSTAYAVGPQRVRGIVEEYLRASASDFDRASWGYVLSDEERRRRFVILSLLQRSGLDCDAYRARFGADPRSEVPELAALEAASPEAPLVTYRGSTLALTAAGLERSDQIGPYLMSAAVRDRVQKGPAA